jgi:hypothetical protein
VPIVRDRMVEEEARLRDAEAAPEWHLAALPPAAE